MKKKSESQVRARPGPDGSVIIERELWYFPLLWVPVGNVAHGVYQAIEALNKHADITHELLRNLVAAEDNLKSSRAKLKDSRYDDSGISKPYMETDEYLKFISGSLSAPSPRYHETLSHSILSKYGLSGAEKKNTRSGPREPANGKRTLVTAKGNEGQLNPSAEGADSVEAYEEKKPENNRNNQNQGKSKNRQQNNQNNRDQSG